MLTLDDANNPADPHQGHRTIAVDAATLAADYHATQLLAAGVPVPTVS